MYDTTDMRTANTPEEESHRQTEMRRSQTGLFSLESDRNRLKRKESELAAEVRRMQSELSHLEASLQENEMALRSLSREIELADEAIVREKKHMNTL